MNCQAGNISSASGSYGKVCGRGSYERWRRLRRYAAMLATFFVLTATGVPGQTSAQTDNRPNILVFLSDDMGWGQPGFNGGTEVATPNMDRLANEGVKLTQFYVQPVCSPTRASLMTGRYAWKNGMELRTEIAASNGMLLDERTIAQALRDAGYATWMVGKWHLGQWRQEHLPLQRGFDHHYGFYSARVDSSTLRRGVILDWHRNGRPVVESGYSTFLLADEAVQLIERHDGNRPFFLYMPFGAVHVPYNAPNEYILEYLHLSHYKQRAMLAAMDVAMGQVMDALDRKGVLDNTLIVFLNDNGALVEAGGNEPYRGLKGSYFEGGIRVPAALRWPGHIPSGSESDALLHVVDLFPTFAGLAGAASVAGLPLDGLDAWETIAEGAESPRQEVVHSPDVIRVGDWKLIEQDALYYNWTSEALRLYNIDEDPYEETNLADSEAEKIAELRERLAYHRPFARDGEAFQEIPDFPPVVYGAEENAAFGDAVQTALEQLDQGNPGPALLRIEVSGTSVNLVYDEALDAASMPPADAFTVVVNPGYHSAEVTSVGVSGSEVVLTIAEAVADGNTVGLTYEVPNTGAIQDADSLEAVGVTWVTGPSDAPRPPPRPPPPPAPTIIAPPPPPPPNSAPTFANNMETRSVAENTGSGESVGAVVAASDTNVGDTLTYSLEGTNASSFDIVSTSGQIQTKAALDYETKNSYSVTVKAEDGHGGSATVPVTITVTDVDEQPETLAAPSVTATSGSTTSLDVAWTAPGTNGGPALTGYEVQYRKGTSGPWTAHSHSGTGASTTIASLDASSEYQVQVRALNGETPSAWSAPGEGSTVAPLRVQMTTDPPPPVEGAFSLTFSFSETVTAFTLADIATQREPASCTDSGNNPVACNPTIAALQTTDDRIFTTSVTPGTDGVAHNYTLTMAVPANRVTSAVGSNLNEAATLEVRIAPPGVTVPISSMGWTASPGNGEVTLGWNAPANTGGAPIVRYEYRWAESGGEFGDWMRVAPAARSATVRELTNGAEYVFEVRPVNSLGYGGVETVRATPSPRPIVVPPPTTGGGGGGGGGGVRGRPPSYPGSIRAEGGDGAVTLTWDAPASQGSSRIEHYEYRIDGEGEWISTGSTGRTHTINGLIAGRVYFFHLRAVSAAGAGAHRISPEATPVADLDFTHFANGGFITSTLALVNAGAYPVRPAIYFYDQDGGPIAARRVVELTPDLEVGDDGALRPRAVMNPLEELTIATHGRGGLRAGSVTVRAPGSIGGVLRFDIPGHGVAGVGDSPTLRDALLPVRRQAMGINTGVAVRNRGTATLTLQCRLMQDGTVLEEVDIRLEVNGQDSRFIDQVFPGVDTSDFVGSVRCLTPEPGRFSAVAFELDGVHRIFTTLPVVPVPAVVEQEQEEEQEQDATRLDFTHFANGGGIVSSLVLVNASANPVGPAIYFYDQDGGAIAAESMLDVPADMEIGDDGALSPRTAIDPLGELTISTHGRGAMKVGSVAVTAEGPMGGVLRFDIPALGVAGVGDSPPLRDVLVPVRRQDGGINTGVALHNRGEAALLVRCRLMRAGAVLEETMIPLAANGQDSRFIDQVFPTADTSDFTGSVRCLTPEPGLFSAVAFELDGVSRIFTTLPVVPVVEVP